MNYDRDWLTSGVDPRFLDDHATKNRDRWDQRYWEKMRGEVSALEAARDQLGEVSPVGGRLMADAFWALMKVDPQLNDPSGMRPDSRILTEVMRQANELSAMTRLRRYTVGDDVAAAFAAVELEPDLETLLDRTKTWQEHLEELQRRMQSLADANAEKRDLDQMIKEWQEKEDDGDGDGDLADLKRQQQELADHIEQLEAAVMKAAAEAEAEGTETMPTVQAMLQQALEQAAQVAQELNESSKTWGLDPGELTRMPAEERLALARKINNPRLRKIAERFGSSWNTFLDARLKRVEYAASEVVNVTIGRDLERVLPNELAKLHHPVRRKEFLAAYADGKLLEYHLEGQDKVAKGAVIWCEDGSGSMMGDPELWAKAMGLCFLHYCRQERRRFHAIHFGGPRKTKRFDFVRPEDYTPERIIEFAECFFNGGTDFETPLSEALEQLQREHLSTGRVEGDIVFATDGECDVTDRFMEMFKSEQERLGFRVWGVTIGGSKDDEPLHTIADGYVFTVQDVLSADEMRPIFGSV